MHDETGAGMPHELIRGKVSWDSKDAETKFLDNVSRKKWDRRRFPRILLRLIDKKETIVESSVVGAGGRKKRKRRRKKGGHRKETEIREREGGKKKL